jgi:hypothetical protein
MIVLDEQLGLWQLEEEIAKWYPGSVLNIKDFRPYKRVLDPQIATLLLEVKQPTFITVNYDDFWRVIEPHSRYCILCLKLSSERTLELPSIVREILHMPEFITKAKRMGKIISVRDRKVDWYE